MVQFSADDVRSQNMQNPSSYNYGLMGLSVTCDFEWSMCGWTHENTGPGQNSRDRIDWKRQRGAGGIGWYKIQGDHTPGKDACKCVSQGE